MAAGQKPVGARRDRAAVPAPVGLGVRPFLVIDVEVKCDEVARRLARRVGPAGRGSLREIVCVSCLSWNPAATPAWQLRSFHRDDMSEADVLENAHCLTQANFTAGGALVTFNGAAHDLPLLRSRQIRWWQCNHSAFAHYLEGAGEHVDVMLKLSRRGRVMPSLSDACAAVGIPLHGPIRMDVDRELPAEREKCERDVIGTTIMYLYVLADATCSNEPLEVGLPDFGRFLGKLKIFNPHLAALARIPVLQGSCGPWGA